VLGFALTGRSGAQPSPAARDSIQAQVQAALDSWSDAWRRSDVVRELNDLETRYAGKITVIGNHRIASCGECGGDLQRIRRAHAIGRATRSRTAGAPPREIEGVPQ